MNKKIKILYFIILIFSIITVFISCTSKNDDVPENTDPSDSDAETNEEHPLEKFGKRIKETKSYQLTTTIDAFPMNMFSVKTQVDGNIQYFPATLLSGEEYKETAYGYEYTYTKNSDGTWQKTERKVNGDGADDFDELFDPNNFEKVAGKDNQYKQKSNVALSNYEDVEITLSSDACEMHMMVKSEGYYVTLLFDKVGEIDLALPKID